MRKLIILTICFYLLQLGKAQSPESLGRDINSEFAERMPLISPDGKTLYFARKYHPNNFGEEDKDDIWVATKSAAYGWNKPFNIGAPLNNKDHNFVIAISPSGNTIYLANDYRNAGKDAVSIAKKQGRSWSKPRVINIEDHYNESQFVGYHVSVDGKVILMSVQRKDGFGSRDLFVSFRKGNNQYSKPRNLGSTINTAMEESFIFLAADGKTIYFASEGHGGFGGLDIFRSQRLDQHWTKWTKPQNLGKLINTPQHDYNFSIPASGDYAYFSRDDAHGMSDLYRIPLPENMRPEPVTLLSGKIIDGTSKQPVDANLKYQSLSDESDQTANDATDGTYQLVIPYGEDVGIYAEQQGYFAVSENVTSTNASLEELDYSAERSKDSEIEGLQQKINQLNQEATAIKQAKREIPKTSKSTKNTKSNAYKDPELEALKAKYNAHYGKKDQTPQSTPTTKTVKSAVDEDDELAKMKAKYNQAYGRGKQESTTVETSPKTKIDSRELLKTKEPQKEDDELAEMKRRYQKAMGMEVTEPEPVAETPVEDFDNLESEVRIELETELITEVKNDLQKELLEDVKEELIAELSIEERAVLKKPTIEAQVTQELSADTKAALKDKYREEVKAELREEWREKIKAELRETLLAEIKAELRKELRAQVKEELRLEMQYQIKKELEAELKAELAEKLKKQENEATKKPSKVVAADTAPKPEAVEPVYQEVEQDIVLIPIEVGQVIPMNNLFFDSNETTLKSASFTELARVLAFLEENAALIVEVGGHTNGWCSHSFANELSDGRAKVVAEYFLENGITKNRIQWKGYGKTAPIASNDNAAGRKKNQRVELKILEILE